jgi:hypothetical protein
VPDQSTLSFSLCKLSHNGLAAPHTAVGRRWCVATEIQQDEFNALVAEAVDSDKTLFVRWIASEG